MPKELAKAAVPAGLFLFQNNLIYIGLTNQEVPEMLSQVHRNLETFRWATQRGSTALCGGSFGRVVLVR